MMKPASWITERLDATPGRYREYAILAAIFLFTLILRLNFIHQPLDRDEGGYFLLGQEILRGGIPYRDVIEMKLPGSFYLFALIMLFGSSVEYIRVITALYTLLTLLATYLVARNACNGRAGLLAALLCGIFSCGPVVQGNGSNLEVFLLLPVMAGVYALFRGFDTGRPLNFAASGLLLAIAVMIKNVALPVYLLPLLMLPFTWSTENSWRRVALNTAAYIGPGIALGALLAAYLVSRNAWDDFIHWNVTVGGAYAKTPWSLFFERMTSRGLTTVSEFMPLWLAALPTLCWLLIKRRSIKDVFLTGVVAAAFIGACLPGKFWPHYFIPLIPPLAVASGMGISLLFEKSRPVRYISLAVLLLAAVPTIRMDYPYYRAPADRASTLTFGSDVFVKADQVARYVKERTKPDDTIFQWGWEPEIYVVAGRRPPNRFSTHMTIDSSPDPSAAIQQLVGSIITSRPAYIIVQSGRDSWPGFPELSMLITLMYHQETVIGGYTLYRLNAA